MGEEEAASEDHTLVATAMGSGTYPSASRSRGPSLDRGTEVGRYVVLRTLGAGGMGVVYAAYDPELDRKVALKLLHHKQGEPGSGSGD